MISYVKGREDLDYEAMRQQRLDAGYTEAEVDEEIAAQFFGTAMAERGWREEQAAKDPGLWQKIIDHVKAFLAEIRDAIEKWAGNDLAVQAAMKTEIEDLDRFCDMFQATLDSITENRQQKNSQNTEQRVENGTGDSVQLSRAIKPAKKKARKSTYYNEEETNFQIWVNSKSTTIGDLRTRKYKGQLYYCEKTDAGFVYLSKAEYEARLEDVEYEDDLKETETGIYGNTIGDGLQQTANLQNMPSDRLSTSDDRNDRFVRGTRLRDSISGSLSDGAENIRQSSGGSTGRRIKNDNKSDKISYSIPVTDQDEIKRLESEPTLKLYRSMIQIDGKLYSPMATYIGGKLNEPYEIGKWYRSEEKFELARVAKDKNGNPKFDENIGELAYEFPLVKGGTEPGEKIGTIWARYNPYEHQSNSPINDQFTGAYKRPNLVVVEFEVPASEDTVKYRAAHAKDPTGWLQWHSGASSAEIKKAGGEERRVFLSRWAKPARVLSHSEVAEEYKKRLAGTSVKVRDNTVPPGLRKELERIGVPIERSGKVDYSKETNYSMAGIGSETADRSKLRAAKEMEKDGADSEEIRQATGWFKGYDGKWRYEVDTSKMRVDLSDLTYGEAFLDSVVSFDALFEAYPELKNIKVIPVKMLDGSRGAYDSATNEIELNKDLLGDTAGMRSTLLHEMQHAIQKIEGFARGASVGYWDNAKQNAADSSRDLYVRTAGEIEARDVQSRRNLTQEERMATRPDIDRTDVVFADGKTDYSVDLSDYDKPVSRKDVDDLRAVITTQKSVNDFTQKDINATAKWAHKYYQQMGAKSPFFRAWFGDWRAYDQTPVEVAKIKGATRKGVYNSDTKWTIQVSGTVFDETTHHKSNQSKNAVPYLAYLEDIIKKAKLLDTQTIPAGKEKSINSLFIHSLYGIADIGNGPELLKLYVEEMYDPNATNSNFRAYKLLDIEKQQAGAKGSQNPVSPVTQTVAVNNVADLYELVKQKDKSFVPGREVSPIVLNEDGTPKVFYHGSDENFTVFDRKRIGKNFYQSGDSVHGGFFFSSDRAFAERNYGKEIYPVYLRIENPHIIEASDFFYNSADYWDFHSENLRYEIFSYYNEDWDEWDKSDYDAVIINHKKDDLVVIRDANQIKSAETGTTRENIGTFSKYDDDIRHSRVLNNSALDYADRLRQTSRQYWEMLDILEDMAGGSQYHNPLDDLLDESNLPETERQRLSDQTLQRIARKYIYQKLGKKTGKATPEQVRELAEKLKKADAVLAGAKENIDVVVYGLYKIFKKDMQDAGHYEETELWVRQFRDEFRDEDGKKVKVYIPANVRADVTEDYGGPKGFRKAMFGMMDITYDEHAGGIDLKEFYSNLRGETEDGPGANVYELPDTDNPSDMINNIVRWYNTDPYSYMPETDGGRIFGMTLEEAATRKAVEAAMDMIYFCEFKEFKKSA